MNRRRFLSALALVGISSAVRSRAAGEVADADKTWYYECKTRLLRGKIPDLSGGMRSTGYPSRLSVEGAFEIAPESVRFPAAKIGRFATSEEMQRARVSNYTSSQVSFFEDTSEPRKPSYWGDEKSGYVYVGRIVVQLTPYLVDAQVTYPLTMVLRVSGKDTLTARATNVVMSGFKEQFRDIKATFDVKEGDTLTMHQVLNQIEKAKGFELDLKDASDRLLARIPFKGLELNRAREWIRDEVKVHRDMMVADLCPRLEKKSGTKSGDVGCFLTTAAVAAVGLEDDCWELLALRSFRDEILMGSEKGRSLVEEYYREAPGIVARVDIRPDANRLWLNAYWLGVLPCALLVRLGFKSLAVRLYRRLYLSLRSVGRV